MPVGSPEPLGFVAFVDTFDSGVSVLRCLVIGNDLERLDLDVDDGRLMSVRVVSEPRVARPVESLVGILVLMLVSVTVGSDILESGIDGEDMLVSGCRMLESGCDILESGRDPPATDCMLESGGVGC